MSLCKSYRGQVVVIYPVLSGVLVQVVRIERRQRHAFQAGR